MVDGGWSPRRNPKPDVMMGPGSASGQGIETTPIVVVDALGGRRQGLLVRLARWDAASISVVEERGGDFRIVILDRPAEEPLQVPRGTAICAPAEPLRRSGRSEARVREAGPAYGARARQADRLVKAAEVALLSRGQLFAAVALAITPREVFDSGRARLDLLACELLRSEALEEYTGPLDLALSAPDTPRRQSLEEMIPRLRSLIEEASSALADACWEKEAEATEAIRRLEQLTAKDDADQFLVSAGRLYPRVPALLEDVYVLRALAERPAEALEVLALRRFVREAQVPPTDRDLWLDRCIALEQLHFAGVVTEPQRLNAARAAMDHFRSRYRERYAVHHRAYWTDTARLRARLLGERRKAESLSRLNMLSELGPPVGEGALEAYQKLLEDTSGCALIVGVEEELAEAAVCPACGLRLDQEPPAERAAEIVQRIERAIARQMSRLSSIAIRQILERSGDPRVERFLKVVQASQMSSLSELLDDELVGYLRRLLVEWRIGRVLEPILSQLQEGAPPKPDEAQAGLRELARVLQRAFRAGRRALPPGSQSLEEGAASRLGKDAE